MLNTIYRADVPPWLINNCSVCGRQELKYKTSQPVELCINHDCRDLALVTSFCRFRNDFILDREGRRKTRGKGGGIVGKLKQGMLV